MYVCCLSRLSVLLWPAAGEGSPPEEANKRITRSHSAQICVTMPVHFPLLFSMDSTCTCILDCGATKRRSGITAIQEACPTPVGRARRGECTVVIQPKTESQAYEQNE
ncbi:hypothetical protein OH76DRAFT_781346 [Lentinus brumalis]|uniref:Secreted protein n=1 Tax=Lentinus brumalis TaxID=2498619 RepID=A0A371D3R3_9APHY|nr:hypothetical protein OH76DRAFT_781346 [Polyporus brumalis]